MKNNSAKTKLLACLCVSAFLLLPKFAYGQYANDPIQNIYKIGGSEEIYLAYTFPIEENYYSQHGIIDIPMDLNSIVLVDSAQFKYIDKFKTATCSGDFNFDGIDEVVSICNNVSGGIKITIPYVDKQLEWQGNSEYIFDELNESFERIRMCSGNFDFDPQDEFIIAYGNSLEQMRIIMFETDNDLNISLVDNYQEITYIDKFFDICAGDIDGDGIDEIVLAKNKYEISHTTNDNGHVFQTQYDLNILEYDTITKEIIPDVSQSDIMIDNETLSGYYNKGYRITDLRVSCGDLDGDNMDEIVVGHSNYHCFGRSNGYDCNCHWIFLVKVCSTCHNYYFCNMVFLNTFDVNNIDKTITNIQNIPVSMSNYGTYTGVDTLRAALTLKCEQLDNIGRDEVLINDPSTVTIFGSAGEGMLLEEKCNISPKTDFLNAKGNEAFLVTDLNPDTSSLDFNKEVILLLSDKNNVEQAKYVTNDLASFEICQIDTISSDTIAFHEDHAKYYLPSDDIGICMTGMVTGEFDLKNTDVYRIGIPEVIPVSELEYPLVILNAPPVHFDVIGGVSHDLCDAFLSTESPPFTATYNSIIGELETTGVEVNNSFGFSSDFRAYAMSGGMGFESSVTTNWEKGKSYYNSNSHNTVISEGKEVYTEDYVLFSSLDYSYYKYPIYDENYKMIGRIAVLNPESKKFTSNWGSGNSWEHPGYIFNHEPGNLLSYRPYENSADISQTPSEFQIHEYSKLPVTNTGAGNFSFTYDNISTSSHSYSFSGGVGASLFTKIGIEGTATLELSFLGIGGSVSSDYRFGVSSELSANYNHSSLKTHNTELRNTFQINGQIGELNEAYDNSARYYITPYIYRSQCGALVLDYMIHFDENNNDWWQDNYGQKNDLAFILPWRYADEKTGEAVKPSKKQKTTDIQFFPPIAQPGDTIYITARVHNFSLLSFENELKVKFYSGNPEKEGTLLTDLYGADEATKMSTMIYGATEPGLDNEEYISFRWKVPDTTTCSPRIFAVIDQDNVYDEIHENNNSGWNLLHLFNCEECNYTEVSTEPKSRSSYNFNIYPSPAKYSATTNFSLNNSADIQIDLYSISGQLIKNIRSEQFQSGEHSIQFGTEKLKSGIYLCVLSVENKRLVKKLIISK